MEAKHDPGFVAFKGARAIAPAAGTSTLIIIHHVFSSCSPLHSIHNTACASHLLYTWFDARRPALAT